MRGCSGMVIGLGLIFIAYIAGLGLMDLRHFGLTPLFAAGLIIGLGSFMLMSNYVALRDRVIEFRRRRKLRTFYDDAIAMRLRGAYQPYISEAAYEIVEKYGVEAAPLLIFALEDQIRQQQPDWRGTASILVMRLASVGDGKALPVLHRLEEAAGSEPISGLADAIRSLTDASQLLRPASGDELLLRPAGQESSNKETLLRPYEP